MTFRLHEVDKDYLAERLKSEKDQVKYPDCFSKEVDMDKVHKDVIHDWIREKIEKELPDDDVVVDYVYELLNSSEMPDIRDIYIQIRDFLGEKQGMKFCEMLWNALLSAQEDPDGIPSEILERQKKKIEEKKNKAKDQSSKTNYNRTSRTSESQSKKVPWYRKENPRRKDLQAQRNTTASQIYSRGTYKSKNPHRRHML